MNVTYKIVKTNVFITILIKDDEGSIIQEKKIEFPLSEYISEKMESIEPVIRIRSDEYQIVKTELKEAVNGTIWPRDTLEY